MMAYGRIYRCSPLMLLYPHHADLHRPEGVTSNHLVKGSEDRLATATIDISTSQRLLERLRALDDIEELIFPSGIPDASSHVDKLYSV
jgi:5-methylcytosine-specific restriction enzyme subunit McrC